MTVTLPCLTFTEPWGSLCLHGIKTLETRKGPVLSRFRGPLVIHRSKAPVADAGLERWGVVPPLRPAGWPEDDRGMALGIVLVKRTWPPGFLANPNIHDIQRRACFMDVAGRYLSELSRVAWFPAPFAARGKQGRWKIDVPAEYLPEWALPVPK